MLRSIAAVAGLTAASACLTTSEPASPCPAIDLGEAEPATFVTRERAPVVAITPGDDEAFVAHWVCDSHDDCELERTLLEGLPKSSQVMVSARGGHVVGVAAGPELTTVMTWQVKLNAVVKQGEWTVAAADAPAVLVASLRGESADEPDWIVARTGGGERTLVRYRPGDNPTIGVGAQPLGTNVPDLLVVGVGERHLLGRKIHSGGEETLYLVDVTDDDADHDARPLLRGPTFSRAVLSPGDTMVIATAGDGERAETFVFDTEDGTLIDRFGGAAISGRVRGEELPGMRAVSPDGSALAYRTPQGSLALRSLDVQSSCLVRSASSGGHELAGFSASGMLYLEASRAPGRHRVFAFDPKTRRLTALGGETSGMRLAAVPGRELTGAEGEDGTSDAHWALGVANGSYAAIMHDTVAGAGIDEPLNLAEVMIMPRDDAAIWLVDTRRREGTSDRTLRVHRLAPNLDPHRGAIVLDRSAPTVPMLHDEDRDEDDAAGGPSAGPVPLELRLGPQATCISTGSPGLASFGCGKSGSGPLFNYGPGDGEGADPVTPPAAQPVAPTTDED